MGMGMGMPGQTVIIEEQRPMGMGMGMAMGMGMPRETVIIEQSRPMPHVKPICFRCNNTHRGPCGMPYKCYHCVCVKCHGTGFNIHKGHACIIMETW